jgi:murein DD-endopeptidase MepM/ murein hydrolase activator NlpD
MSCCPGAPAAVSVGGAFNEANGAESDIRPGESIECYMARGGNTSGKHDDATDNVKNKIENNSVPLTRSSSAVSTNTQFKLTAGSDRTATSWTISETPPGLTMTTEGLLSGTFSDEAIGKTYNVQVEASDPDGTIDNRAFVIAPTKGGESDEIRLISPLPGAIVNSKFGLRMHPIQKVQKMHTGIDMKYSDRSVKDVVAAADGEVQMCGGNPSTGYGIRVWVKHTTSSGKHLCTTTYNHLNKIYVTQGQKVMAGQKIALEGTTGSSTGNHLHFEVKLPDGKFVDPEPLINGSLTVADKTLPNGDADQSSLSTKNSNASMSEKEAEAKQNSCEPYGPTYPAADPPETTDPTPESDDPFEKAWKFTMQSEVGPHWMTSPQFSPGDSELDAGLIETKQQRYKVGYVNTQNFPGGETKFGIAQKPNPSVKVTTMDYAAAKQMGFNNYWKISSSSCANKAKKVGVMLFDINYHHGCGNARTIYANAGITSATSDSADKALEDCRKLNAARVQFIKNIGNPKYQNGWLDRASKSMSYVQSLT